MPQPPLSDDLARAALDAVAQYGTISGAAAALGIPRPTFQNRVRVGRERGFHLSDGVRNAIASVGAAPFEVQGGWLKTKEASIRFKISQSTGLTWLEQVRGTFEGLTPARPIAAPRLTRSELLTLYLVADAHIGMLAHEDETGAANDLETACARLVEWVSECVAASPASEQAVVLGVGDLMHANDRTNSTPASKHVLDVAARHYHTVRATIEAMAACIELAAAKHKRVIVRLIEGNHDPDATHAVAFALAERYRLNDRIHVELSPAKMWVLRHGVNLLAAHHGDRVSPERLTLELADSYAAEWGATRWRFLFTGHLHSHKGADIGGLRWEQLRAVTTRDAYAAGHGWTSRAELQAITYHAERGEVSRVKVAA